jgi:hypothetical protein
MNGSAEDILSRIKAMAKPSDASPDLPECDDKGINALLDVVAARAVTIAPHTHYVVDDCDTRTSTVAYFDGNGWWLPGSEMMHSAEEFDNGRFQIKSKIAVTHHAYGPWKVESGRFA